VKTLATQAIISVKNSICWFI